MAISTAQRVTLAVGVPAIVASAVVFVILSAMAVDGPPEEHARNRVMVWVLTGQYVIDEGALFWARAWFAIWMVTIAATVTATVVIAVRQARRRGIPFRLPRPRP